MLQREQHPNSGGPEFGTLSMPNSDRSDFGREQGTSRDSAPAAWQAADLAATRARWILPVLHLGEEDVDELAADLLHPPDVDGLHHIAGVGIDRHRAARAVPLQALGGGN